jgi:hypothetical protein
VVDVEQRRDVAGRRTRRLDGGRRDRSLVTAPAEVLAALSRGGQVDLLARVLPDVADPEVAGLAVEGEPPGVAQPVRPDLVAAARGAGERVVLRDRVGRATRAPARVDADELAEQRVEILAVVARVVAPAAVAEAGVQQPAGVELELAAVVVGVLRVRLAEHEPADAGLGPVRIARGAAELADLQ